MDSWCGTASLKVHPAVDRAEKSQTVLGTETLTLGNKVVSQSADLKTNSPCSNLGKRKRQCELSQCSSCGTSPLKNYANFMKSGLLSRLMYHQDGEWIDFPKEVMEIVRNKFQMKHAVVDVEMYDSRFILDVMYMRKLDITTGMQKPIAWIDDAGSCFFPEICDGYVEQQGICHFDSHEKSTPQDINLQLQIEFSGANANRFEKNMSDKTAFKKIRVGQSLNGYDSDSGSNDDTETGDSRLVEYGNGVLDRNASTQLQGLYNDVYDVNFSKVYEMFRAGMECFPCSSIVEIKGCSGKAIQKRLELFNRVVEHTKQFRGSANVQYAWLPCSRRDISSIMTYGGLGHGGLLSISSYGYGVHLSSKNYAYASVKKCDDDENGIRQMLLCRVVLGNVEPISVGSGQFCPSSDQFDTGVDNIIDPQVIIVWEVNALTHIYPEYVVSFKLASRPEEAVDAQVGSSEVSGLSTTQVGQFASLNAYRLNYHPGTHVKNENQGRAAIFGSTSPKAPDSPWMPFHLLFEIIAKEVPPKTMQLVHYHYNLFKCKKSIARSEFIRRLRMAVGDTLLKSAITSLQCKQPTAPRPANLKLPKPEPEP